MHCDYCPKYFHFDCLTPPLTTPPVGLWMCPLHVEHFMEATMLGTSWMSERVALWGFTNRQVNRSSVELKFLSKCGRKNPPFSRKIPWPPKQRVNSKFYYRLYIHYLNILFDFMFSFHWSLVMVIFLPQIIWTNQTP